MTTTLELGSITQSLPELVDQLAPGDELILTRNHQTVAKLTGEAVPDVPPTKKQPPPAGWCKGLIVYMAPDFDEPLEDMKEYME